jgi:hypothetical protein
LASSACTVASSVNGLSPVLLTEMLATTLRPLVCRSSTMGETVVA